MWSSSNMDLNNLELVLDHESSNKTPEFEPSPYMFTKVENGKKIVVEPTTIVPPSWLLLDHTIAVIWLMFSLKPSLQQLGIDDLKWAHLFLREIKNCKGENPPDVKACLKEIQDRLINLYAKLTSLKDEDFDEIAAAFGENIMADTSTSYLRSCSLSPARVSNKCDAVSIYRSLSPSNTTLKMDYPTQRRSSKDGLSKPPKKTINTKHKSIAMNYTKRSFPLLGKESNIFEETTEDEEVEKYILSLFEDDKKEENTRTRSNSKSLIPTKRKNPTVSISEMMTTEGSSTNEITKKEKSSKKVHCVAEMRSLKFQKSMKVQETTGFEGGEEAAYSNLKAEIRRLTINPNVSKCEIMKFLKEWRSEQVDRLHNDLKRLNSIEEFMKNIHHDKVEENQSRHPHKPPLKLDTKSSTFTLGKSLLS